MSLKIVWITQHIRFSVSIKTHTNWYIQNTNPRNVTNEKCRKNYSHTNNQKCNKLLVLGQNWFATAFGAGHICIFFVHQKHHSKRAI